MTSFTRYALPLLLILCAVGTTGCGGGGGPRAGITPGKPTYIKPPAPPADVPVDPALQAAARQALADAAAAPEPAQRAHALEGMRQALGPAAGSQAVRALADGNAVVRFAGAMAAGELKLAEAKPRLLALLKDPDPNVGVAARFALHRLGDTTYSHDLERTAFDQDVRVQVATAMALGRLGEPTAGRILRRMRVGDGSAAVRQQAAESLWRLGDEQGLDDLMGLTSSGHPDDQMFGLLGVAVRRDARTEAVARAGLTADWDEVKLVAARALAMVSDVTGAYDLGYDVAAQGVQSGDPRRRVLGALAFGAIGRTDAQEKLQGLLKDADPDVRIAAATALLQIGQHPRNAV